MWTEYDAANPVLVALEREGLVIQWAGQVRVTEKGKCHAISLAWRVYSQLSLKHMQRKTFDEFWMLWRREVGDHLGVLRAHYDPAADELKRA